MTAASLYQNEQAMHEHENVPCVEFSAMGFARYEHEHEHESQLSLATASTMSSTGLSSGLSRSSNLSGWGSAISRKSYACLKTLGETEARKMQRPPRQVSRTVAIPEVGENWGYFVDTTDNK
jgi:hypothetical protein